MSSSDTCPNCNNIYGNEPRKIPCGHIVCHKCCLVLFNKENNTLECPDCSVVHTFKSKNIFKKSLQQIAHSGFGKKTSSRDVSFASTMPLEKASSVEKSVNKEMKKAVISSPNIPLSVPREPSPVQPPPPPPPLMPARDSNVDSTQKIAKQKSFSPSITPPSSLLDAVIPSSMPTQPLNQPNHDVVVARCHSCSNRCEVIVCDHCDHFVCLKCAEEHRTNTNDSVKHLMQKWQECKLKYSTLIEKLETYDHDGAQIERDLAAIRVAVEQRTQDAIHCIFDQRDHLINTLKRFIDKEGELNSIKHNELVDAFQQLQNRLQRALQEEDIGSYNKDNFMRDISEFQNRIHMRSNLIEKHTPKIPRITQYERIPIERLLGELRFNSNLIDDLSNVNSALLSDNVSSSKHNGYAEYSSPKYTPISPLIMNIVTPPSNCAATVIEAPTAKTPNVEQANGTIDAFEEFRRMATIIHQQFNAPYSKIINSASSLSPSAPAPAPTPIADNTHTTNSTEKSYKSYSATTQNKTLQLNIFIKSWKVEHTAVPNFLCMTPFPTPKFFVVDKYGKVSVSSIPPKPSRPFESYTLFPNGTDEWIESVVASTHFLIVYSRKKQDTMTGTMYFFNHECKPVIPNGIHQSIPVHHILCDQNANRLYCLDRMRCTIYYYTLPNNSTEIESCMKTREDFAHFNSAYTALKMLQNDEILGFYERTHSTVHLYDKKTKEHVEEIKCDHFMDKFESWGIIAIRKDGKSLVFKVDERGEHDAVSRQHIVYEISRSTKQVISKIQLNSVFGMIIGPSNEIILGIRQTKESGIVQCYTKK